MSPSELHRVLFEGSSDAIMLLDTKGFFDCNPATLKIFGATSRTDFLSKHSSELSPAMQPCGTSSEQLANERIAYAFEHGSHQFEWMHKHINGSTFAAEVWLTAYTHHDRAALQATVRDISQRKELENKLQQSHDLLEDLLFSRTKALEDEVETRRQADKRMQMLARFSEHHTDEDFFASLMLTMAKAINVKIVFASKLISTEPAMARSLAIRVDNQYLENFEWPLLGTPCLAVSQGESVCFTEHVQEAFPEDVWLQEMDAQSYIGIPMRNSVGQVIGCLGIVDDKPINAPQHIEQTLQIYADRSAVEIERRKSDKMLRLTQYSIDHSSDIVLWLDQHGKVINVNDTACQKLGYTRDEWLAMQVFNIDAESSPQTWSKLWESVKKQGLQQQECTFQTKQGESIAVACSHNYVCFEGREYQFMFASDISHQKKSDAASQAKSRFISNMSHELRTPMHGIIGLQNMLSKDADYLLPEHRRHLDLAQHSSHVLLTLIDDVLDLSKIEAHKMVHTLSDINLPDLLHNALLPFITQADSKNIQLSLIINNLPQIIHADASHIRQILLNLVGNAVKFTQQGYINVTAGFAAGILSISIEDTGIGITKDNLPMLFEPFVQFSEDAHLKGTGLGTTISQRLAKAVGGNITVQSEYGKGTTFNINIPVKTVGKERVNHVVDLLDIPIKATSIPVKITQDISVLLAEDDPISLMIAEDSLRNIGINNIDTAEHGKEAWEKLQANTYDLLLTDIRMPGLDGIELTRRIRAREKETKSSPICIVGLSAHAMNDVARECMAVGMDDFISKPIEADALLQRLSQKI